jgi:hypothetical protein
MKPITTFREFWDFYVTEHRHPLNRALHFVGSSAGLVTAACALATGQWWLLPVGPVIGYVFAWIGHFAVERNRPATFKYPLWSFAADWVMWFKILTRSMEAELVRLTDA